MWTIFIYLIAGVLISDSLTPPVNLIIDTDASYDVDDVVAICSAHALMDAGEVDIKAIVHNAGYPLGIGAISVLNTFYGHENIRLGEHKRSLFIVFLRLFSHQRFRYRGV